MSCIICCDDYTEKLRRPIKCPGCKKDVCLNCFKRHLIDDRNLQCMFPDCDKTYSFTDIGHLTENIKFSNEIMDKFGLIALEEEKNFLPQRQKIAKRRIEEQKYELRRIERNKIKSEINRERYQLDNKLRQDIRTNEEIIELDRKIRELNLIKTTLNSKLFREKDEQIKPFFERIKIIDKEDSEDRIALGLAAKKENNYTFVKNCVYKNCKGFLENNLGEKGWKCTLCDRFTCRKCHEPLVSTINDQDKKVKHECNEDIVMNIKELKKDTKPCPKCGMGIFKVSGCSTMFCIGCQTYFDWNSGKIHKRAVHNPDAVRWMRERGTAIPREEGDDGCTDPFVNNHIFYNWMYRTGKAYLANNLSVFNTIIELANYGTHITEVVVPRFADHYINKSEELSIDYLIVEDYTEEKWKKDIRKFKKQQMFNHEFRDIITLLTEVMRTVLANVREMITRRMPVKDIVKQLELIPTVVIECNEKFEDIKKCYNSKRKNCFIICRARKNVLFELRYK